MVTTACTTLEGLVADAPKYSENSTSPFSLPGFIYAKRRCAEDGFGIVGFSPAWHSTVGLLGLMLRFQTVAHTAVYPIDISQAIAYRPFGALPSGRRPSPPPTSENCSSGKKANL